MTAQDYPITFGYGATDDIYYGPNAQGKSTYIGPYHRGDDRAMPVGTPVVVNGVTIGLSGNGNGRYGAHLHVGRFVGGADTDPKGGGFALGAGAKVIGVVNDFSADPINAKYVRIQDSSGDQWVYLHMSQINVSIGEELKGGTIMSPEALVALYALGTNKQINGSDQFVTSYQGKDPLAVIEDLYKSTANVELRTKAANFDNVQRALSNAYSTIEQLKHEVSGDVSGKLQTLQTDLQAALDKSKI